MSYVTDLALWRQYLNKRTYLLTPWPRLLIKNTIMYLHC